jgi:hypothetical protein
MDKVCLLVHYCYYLEERLIFWYSFYGFIALGADTIKYSVQSCFLGRIYVCMDRADDTFFTQSMRGYRLAIFTQLRQVIESMHQPEQVFQWLGSVIVQSFDVSIVQFWTARKVWSGYPSAQLRAMTAHDPSQPAYLIGEKVAVTVEEIARRQPDSFSQPVERLFPQYLASLLKRYGLNYCTCCLANRNVRFPPGQQTLPHASASTELTFLALLFQSYYPHQDLISTMSIILEQAIVVAESRGLLIPGTADPASLSLSQRVSSDGPPTALHGLVPRKKQDARLLLSSNPFATPVVISDKQAHRLYEAIDGHKTVADLCRNTGMTIQEAYEAIQKLLSLQYIDVFTSEGGPADIGQLI